MPSATARFDRATLLLTSCLLGLGIVMLYSSSADTAAELTGDHTYFLKRQLLRILLGALLLLAASRFDYHRLKALAGWLVPLALLLLALTLVAHQLAGRTGAARWLWVGPFSVQPSDFARLALIIFLAAYLERKGSAVSGLGHGFLPPVVMIGVIMLLLVLEPDFSTAVLTGLLGLTILFLGGARLKHLAALGAVALPVLLLVMMAAPYRRLRVLTFLGRVDSPQTAYQSSQSLIGLGNGGWLGQGLGNGVEKRLFLPAAHTDFVFATIGEELGFAGAVAMLVAFFWLFQRGIAIARNAPDRFGMFLALGIVFNMLLYVLVNVAVVTELFPTTGIPLPLVSYGGTHLVFTLLSLGILLNISSSAHVGWWRRLGVYGRAQT